MKYLIIIVALQLTHSFALANYACTQKLESKQWPLDCFLFLQLQKVSPEDKKYTDFDKWCKIYSIDLLKNPPPEALFSLHLPQNCLNIALSARDYAHSQEILKGSFLNSFP